MGEATPDAKQIFLEALDRQLPEDLQRYLDEACGDNTELRARVEALLRAHREVGDFLADPPSAGVTIDQRLTESPGTQIGPYKLLQQLGEGGFGVVYMAEQSEPVERRVALKIIKPGMDTHQVIARFEAEEQALAMMDHPNIAKVHDAGATDSGRPYFVMELVHGVPITQYCDQQHLTPKERLDLFIPVCHAVQHAHQKGIIHRDLKPSNVLVALYDDQPVPKVIDFGVAKATSQKLTEKTMFTHYGQIVGTLEYMSPEQANLNQLDVDTRSDIYALGVLLYELLTGTTPFERQRLRSAGYEEMLRIIREEEPPKPSLRLSSSDTLPSVAANRGIEPKQLSTQVHGELDWIVMKALEKDRTRRYATANEFADDILRHLHDQAVLAGPPSATYRFRKFARRHKTVLGTVAVITVAILLGIAGTTWQAIRAMHQRDRAVAAEEQAQTEAAIARAVNQFLNQDLLAQADPESEPDRDIKLRTVLDRAADKVETRFADQPAVEVAARNTLGKTYQSLGEYKSALQHFERALGIQQRLHGEAHPDTLASMNNVATALHDLGQNAEAEKLHARVLELRRQVLGPEHPHTLESMNNLAVAIRQQGRAAEAEQRHAEVLELRRRVLGPKDLRTLDSMNNLAAAIMDQGRWGEAEKLNRQVLEGRQSVLGPKHPRTLRSMQNLANTLYFQARYADAEAYYVRLVDIRSELLGSDHPHTLDSMNNLASAISALGRYPEAEKLYRKVLNGRRDKLGPNHPATLASMHNLAASIYDQGRAAEAEPLYRELLEIQKVVQGPEHPDTLRTMTNLALAIRDQDRAPEAETLFREMVDIRTRVQGAEHPDTLDSMNKLAGALRGQKRFPEAEELQRKVLEIQRSVLTPDHADTLRSMNNLAGVLYDQQQYPEAEALFREALDGARRTLGSEHPTTLVFMNSLANSISKQARHADAEPLYREAYETRRKVLGPAHGDTLNSLDRLGEVVARQDHFEQAEEVYREALETRRTALGPTHRDTLATLFNLARVVAQQNRLGESERLFREALETRRQVLGPTDRDTLDSLTFLALTAAQQNHLEQAEKLYREALDGWRSTVGDEDPATRATVCNLASVYTNWSWQLATAADVSARDPAKAVELANQALKLQPDDAGHWNNLGVAQYRTGNWQAAVDALEKADGILEQGDREHRMFLAMAHWQLGNKDKARERYTEGAAWIAAHAPDDEEQIRFRAEAEQLMGITESDRQQRVEQFLGRPADKQDQTPKEQPPDQKPETDSTSPNEAPPEEKGTDS